MGKVKEYTRKVGFLWDEWWETTVVDEKGNKGIDETETSRNPSRKHTRTFAK